ncbi:Fucolectin-7 [Anabarilius grahami]|uniref:Fucolectin-7 n=1 Tax=Anabarilius grahami TaxID=495550 RepID=A0A3N0Z389_ANAGA|nr:Fucolectin-7 [Anabarilius grahami]
MAVQSSTDNPLGDAEHAVDGNRDSDYRKGSCTHTKTEFNPWWRVDLGNVYSISNITITNRQDCCKEWLKGAQIRIGNSLANNGNNNELVATILTVPDGTETFSFELVNGRYVNIFLPGNDEILTLCEVEVFTGNLALGATAVQSSTYDQFTAAQNAVDDNKDSIYSLGSCSVTNADMDPWWRVDLLDVYRITRVSITNRGDGYAERINGAQIRIGNSLENNGNNNQLAATVVSIPLGETQTLEFKPIIGRYVNIIIPGRNEYLTLCELEVFSGCSGDARVAFFNGPPGNKCLDAKSPRRRRTW